MKKVLALILATVLVLSLAACASSSGGGQSSAGSSQPAAGDQNSSGNSQPAAGAPAPSEGGDSQQSEGWAPDGPVTMIVSYAAGNGTDITARLLSHYAEKYVGQSIVI